LPRRALRTARPARVRMRRRKPWRRLRRRTLGWNVRFMEEPRRREDASAGKVTNPHPQCQRCRRHAAPTARRNPLSRERWSKAWRHPQTMSTVWGTRNLTSGSLVLQRFGSQWTRPALVDNARFHRLVRGGDRSIYSPFTGCPTGHFLDRARRRAGRSPRGENGKLIFLHSCGYHCGEPLGKRSRE
jgi:hypothetical protein